MFSKKTILFCIFASLLAGQTDAKPRLHRYGRHRHSHSKTLKRNADVELEIEKRLNYLRQGSSYRFQRQQPDGRVFEMQGNPLPGGGFVTTYNDVSSFVAVAKQLEASNNTLEQRVAARTQELELLNQQLASAKQQLEEQTISKNRFFAAASHDLLQPFNAAALFCGLIREQTQQLPQVQQLTKNLANSLNSAEDLLASILELTKLDSGVVKAQPSQASLTELLDHIAREAKLIAAEKQLQFHYQRSSAWVMTDIRLLRRVVQNLVSNAIRYTEHGKIVLGCRHTRLADGSSAIRIEVWDTGIGISAEDQHHIFQEFQQGTHADQRGLGIGLAISQRISLLLQHPLTLRSQVGSGSCFAITLPRVQTPTPAIKPQSASSSTVNFSGKTVLLMDNEAQLRTAVAALLRSWQCEVWEASKPAEALALLQAHGQQTHTLQNGGQPDLLLFDYHLDAGATGVEVALQLQQHFSLQAPVVIHSADQQQSTRDAGMNAGFHFMLKPLKEASLKRLLQRLLR